ncbi:hypothetical protein HMPREF0765_2160 [Sphingobacterium spiritivorum ATCC 33300]|uniref:Uncharacterized protein n=1 Tax=Sphingobacterium spiritivorum ATCC 33300 TaxID=525372 RepID=C2FXV4_SPHSI|nr:hypothetical protein [Sphingobacterium spiritivorum]EEI92233.1 hypothetical protein HMPREF0765_2160 [Sphingobacterium spiritivorum ATCC 33300]QQS96725.1 hypothetical protein I6J03_03150 [Sphingobacterium spiritivorum]
MKIYINILCLALILFINVHEGKSQSAILKNGNIISNQIRYDVRIMPNHNYIFISDLSVYDKEALLINSDKDAMFFPEGLIKINKAKLLNIKRMLYNSDKEVTIGMSINVNESKLIGLKYTFPKSPSITETQFRAFDADIREHLVIELLSMTILKDRNSTAGLTLLLF